MDLSKWNEILSVISNATDTTRFETWFRPLKALEISPNRITLEVQNNFILDFLEKHYKDKILAFSQQVIPSVHEIRLIVAAEGAQTTQNITYNKKEQVQKKSTSHDPILEDTKIIPKETIKQVQNSKIINPQYNFDNFVGGSSNEFAKSVSEAVALNPGKTKFNPLLIYSGVGLGKTHLLHAIYNGVVTKFPHHNIKLFTSEEFYFRFIDAIKNSSTKNFTDEFKDIDLLLIDDIQFLSGKERTQEEFFYIFNTLYQHQKQIVLTSDQPPETIKGIHDRLISRFKWGLTVDIQPPDLETRVAILKMKAEKDDLVISEKILYYIAENISKNIRELEGVVLRLLAYASITKTEITIDLVKSIIGGADKKPEEKKKLDINDIIKTVAEYYKIPANVLKEKNRSKEVAHSRQVAMYICKKHTRYSLKSIGLHFGGRDHSTVIHAVRTIEKNQREDTTLQEDINYILSTFKN